MLNRLDLSENLTTRIGELIELKSTISETYLHKGENKLIELIREAALKELIMNHTVCLLQKDK